MERAFDRVLLARHFALSLGAVAAYVFRTELRIGYVALWIVGISATLNFLAYVFRTQRSLAKLCMIASPLIGLGGWGALIAVTAGVASPFIAGLWLEIVLSAMAQKPRGIVLVGLGSVLALWLPQLWVGMAGHWLPMVLQSGFLVGMALATYLVTRRWARGQENLAREHIELGERLDALTRQLEDERVVAALGENVARLAHGLKNAVHSLRGFVSLIEPKLVDEGGSPAALRGLRSAIDDLESLALATLGSKGQSAGGGSHPLPPGEAPPVADPPEPESQGRVLPVIERAIGEISSSHPGVRWDTRCDGARPALPLSESSLAETLVILLRNAVEAMGGRGRGSVETCVTDGQYHVMICDDGVGFADAEISKIFDPGYTTKDRGSGYGLFLARRIVEEQGGSIHAQSRPERGAIVELSLPVLGASERGSES